jgi:hypothetical protein
LDIFDDPERQIERLEAALERCRFISSADSISDPIEAVRLRTDLIDLFASLGQGATHWLFELRNLSFTVRVRTYEWNEQKGDVEPDFGEQIDVDAVNRAGELVSIALARFRSSINDALARTPKAEAAQRRSSRGPEARNNLRITEIAESYRPWRKHLADVCGQLDEERILISARLKENLERQGWDNPDWTDALEEDEHAVVESIKYSIRYCKVHGSATTAHDA